MVKPSPWGRAAAQAASLAGEGIICKSWKVRGSYVARGQEGGLSLGAGRGWGGRGVEHN